MSNVERTHFGEDSQSKFIKLLDKLPDALVLLTLFAVAGMILTWIVPAGEYARELNPVTKVKMVVANSFQYLETSNPQGILDFLYSFWDGLKASGIFTVYLLMIGGALSIVSGTGAIDALLCKADSVARNKKSMNKLVLIVLTLFFGFCGSTFGMSAETLIFLPILIALCRTLNYDAVVAVGLSIAACNLGYACGTTNPFNIGIAQGIAELPLMSGIGFRFAWAGVSFAVTIAYYLRYCAKIEKDPSQSLVSHVDYSDFATAEERGKVELTFSRIFVIVALLASIGLVVYGAIVYRFGFKQLSTIFLTLAFLSAIVCRMRPSEVSSKFAEGAGAMVIPLLLLGVARSFLILMQNGLIVDTIINFLVQPLLMVPESISVIVMVLFQSVLNFFIPAASGQAAISMPIIIPIADLLDINRQVAVFAFQIGDGFGNAIIPTFGPLMAALAIARVPYGRWVAFMLPLLIIQYTMGAIATVIANMINLGPF